MTPPVDLAARLRAESSGSEAFHGSEYWHPCAKFTGDENAGCIMCQWRFDAHLMWEAADALDALHARAIAAEHHKALEPLGKGSAAEQVERELRIQLAETQVALDALTKERDDAKQAEGAARYKLNQLQRLRVVPDGQPGE